MKNFKTLYVFGDSYVSSGWAKAFAGLNREWPKLLSDKLNTEYKNFAVSGSSSEYAMRQFYNLISNKTITNSVFVILMSTVGRLDLEIQNTRPETAATWCHLDNKDELSYPKNVWLRENFTQVQWYLRNFNYKNASINRECYIHAIRNFAESESSNQVIVLQNHLQGRDYEVLLPRLNTVRNFMIPEIDVNLISTNEIIGRHSYKHFTQYTKYDPRVNHLTNPNLKIMSDSVYDMIATGDQSRLRYDNFKQNIITQITSRNDLERFIKDDLLYPNIIKMPQ